MLCFTALIHGPILPVASRRNTISAMPFTFGSWLTDSLLFVQCNKTALFQTGVKHSRKLLVCYSMIRTVKLSLRRFSFNSMRTRSEPTCLGDCRCVNEPRGRAGRPKMRKLASIQPVNATEPIPNADAIEKIRVLGWWAGVKKGELKPGDRVVYCEIDSLLPERAEFEFLRPNCFKPAQTDATGTVTQAAGFRIKTIKLRGQVSQGICFPLSVLPEGTATDEDADVTESLAIRKWEPPQTVGMGGRVKGSFPGFLPKTDETRVQVLEKTLKKHSGV